ncbi:hypothetical protein LNP25_28095 [Klebsiella variicola subsp. variicola]|nr:hypothetical protein [Klebsiella variicola subsp. variicola]
MLGMGAVMPGPLCGRDLVDGAYDAHNAGKGRCSGGARATCSGLPVTLENGDATVAAIWRNAHGAARGSSTLFVYLYIGNRSGRRVFLPYGQCIPGHAHNAGEVGRICGRAGNRRPLLLWNEGMP